MNDNSRLQNRISELEISLMHLQKDFDALNSTVLLNVKQIEAMEKTIDRLSSRIATAGESEVRDAESEKPPHY